MIIQIHFIHFSEILYLEAEKYIGSLTHNAMLYLHADVMDMFQTLDYPITHILFQD